MPELVYFVAVSLDGRIAGPAGDFSAFPTEGDHIDWIASEYCDTLPAPALAAMGLHADNSRFGSVVMGWNTYAVGLPFGLTSPYPHLEQIVATRDHLADVPDDVQSTDDPVAEVRRRALRDDGDIWLCGGGSLAAALADEIDRLVLKVNPLVLGAGPSLFDGRCSPHEFRPVGTRSFTSGVVVQEYHR